jgi:hypothetical protein
MFVILMSWSALVFYTLTKMKVRMDMLRELFKSQLGRRGEYVGRL